MIHALLLRHIERELRERERERDRSVNYKKNWQTLILMHTVRAIVYSINLQQHACEI